MKVLCVAEKHSVAKAVADILGGGYQRRATNDKFLFNLDFEYDFPGWGPCDVTMTSVRGHLTGTDYADENLRSWKSCNPARLFAEPLKISVSKGMTKIARNIATEAQRSEKLVIWTDCDREGEYIGWEIAQQARARNPGIEIKRAIFSDLERSHVLQAARGLRELDMNAVNAVAVRLEVDFRTGTAFTRMQTMYLQQRFRELEKEIISYGSCQFPTLGFIVDRYLRRTQFVAETFWHITLKCRAGRKHFVLTSKRGHVFDRAVATALYKRLIDSGQLPRVTEVNSRPTTRQRPLPLTTVELLKLGSRSLKLSAQRTLKVAEELYQQSFISYPRTETDQFSDETDLSALLAKQKLSNHWGEYATTLVDGDAFCVPRKGRHNDKAHPPIHPIAHTSNFKSDDHKRVYELIARHFMACCSKDARGLLSTIQVSWHEELFSASGLTVLERNFLDIYPYIKWESSAELPAVEVGQELPIVESLLAEGKTTPPKLLTEPELLTLMDLNGIGTDATMAEHIEKILDRSYIYRCNAQGQNYTRGDRAKYVFLTPSTLGLALVEGYDSIGLEKSLTKPFLRKDLETQLSRVSNGQIQKDQVLEATLRAFKAMFDLTTANLVKLETSVRRRLET